MTVPPQGGEPSAAWALFLDFDGTLVDIAERPDDVVVGPGLLDLLLRLRLRAGGALAIVTGRTVADLEGFLPDGSLDVCGVHGLERRVAGLLSSPAGLAELRPEIARLTRAFADRPGILVEDKGVGVAIHWRMAPDAEHDAKAAIAELARRLGPAYRIQDGKAVRELVPAAAGKGAAIRALMTAPPYLGRRPIFVGDDRTDEDGFAAVDALGGTGVKVGPGPTGAGRRIARRAGVRPWLEGLVEGSAGPGDLPAA